jgi:hypothetical protein
VDSRQRLALHFGWEPTTVLILAAGATVRDPDDRVLAMLGARSASIRGNESARGQQYESNR